MAQVDIFKSLLDAGTDFRELTQKRAEKVVKSLVDAGEVQSNQAQQMVKDLVEQAKKNRERLLSTIEREVQAQVGRMGLATKSDIERLEKKINAARPAPAKKATKRKSTAKKAGAKKAAAKGA